MVILFILIIIGYAANKQGFLDPDFDRKLSRLVINYSCPGLILSAVLGGSPDKNLMLPILAIGFVTYIFLILMAVVLSRFLSRDAFSRNIYAFMLVFGNVGFIGYPVIVAVFGEDAIFYASLFNLPFTFFAFSIGTYFVKSGNEGNRLTLDRKALYTPTLVASYLSIIIVYFDLGPLVPTVISEPIRLIGTITVPAAMLVIGSSMANIPMRTILGNKTIYAMAAIRLTLLPIFILFLSRALGVDETVCQINAMLSAMPVATFGTMFCLQFNKDVTLMTQGIVVSTILSMVTIPLITLLF